MIDLEVEGGIVERSERKQIAEKGSTEPVNDWKKLTLILVWLIKTNFYKPSPVGKKEGPHSGLFSFFMKKPFFVIVGILLLPGVVNAGFLSFIGDLFEKAKLVSIEEKQVNAQTMDLLQAATNPDPNRAKGGGDITIVGSTALLSEDGPAGTALDVEEKTESGHISVYVVRPGDNLSTIAKLFGVTKNTILWANDIKGGVIQPGQTLVILPVSGLTHTVVKGDTIKSIAKKYKADEDEIAQYNLLDDDAKLAIGDKIIVPDGEISVVAPKISKVTNPWRKNSAGPTISGYYMRPIAGGTKTQGLHGYNGVDLANFRGAPILASAAGAVIISRSGGWNAGYGNYIVIQHDNGTQTLYAHLSKNLVSAGQNLAQGQVIGEMGSTGKATGVHLHFEVRGAANPF